MVRSKPGASPTASPAKPPALPTARPGSLSSSGRSPSIITPSSPTLLNARIVVPAKADDPSSVETIVRPLSPHDVLSGRGGLVNGYVGNVTYRNMVAERRTEYLAARKRDKAEVARSIVRAVLERGGMFLKRVDDPNKSKDKDGGGGDKEGAGGPGDGRGSKWEDIGEARAREKTSQALREGLDVRGKGETGKSKANVIAVYGAASEAAAAVASAAGDSSPPPKKRGRPKKAASASASSPPPAGTAPPALSPPPLTGVFTLASFLPHPVAQFLSRSSPAITTPDEYAEATKTAAGRNDLASALSVWSNSLTDMGADRSYDWIGSLGTVELWRRQVEVWTDGAAFLKERQEEQAADESPSSSSPPPKKKARGAAKKKGNEASIEV